MSLRHTGRKRFICLGTYTTYIDSVHWLGELDICVFFPKAGWCERKSFPFPLVTPKALSSEIERFIHQDLVMPELSELDEDRADREKVA